MPLSWLVATPTPTPQSCPPAGWHLPPQVPMRDCGSTLMLPMQALPSCALSSGGFWRASSMPIPSPLTLPSGWWCTLTVLGSGECGSQASSPWESLASSAEASATNARLETHRVKDKYKLQQTFSVNPIYLRHANSGMATDFMVSGWKWWPLRWKLAALGLRGSLLCWLLSEISTLWAHPIIYCCMPSVSKYMEWSSENYLKIETNLWGSMHISWICVAFLNSQKYLFYHEWISSFLSPSWIIFSAYCLALGKGGEFPWVGKEDSCLNHFYLLSPQRQGGSVHGRWLGIETELPELLDASEQSWPFQLSILWSLEPARIGSLYCLLGKQAFQIYSSVWRGAFPLMVGATEM